MTRKIIPISKKKLNELDRAYREICSYCFEKDQNLKYQIRDNSLTNKKYLFLGLVCHRCYIILTLSEHELLRELLKHIDIKTFKGGILRENLIDYFMRGKK